MSAVSVSERGIGFEWGMLGEKRTQPVVEHAQRGAYRHMHV
jgi:hypothetical protein